MQKSYIPELCIWKSDSTLNIKTYIYLFFFLWEGRNKERKRERGTKGGRGKVGGRKEEGREEKRKEGKNTLYIVKN